MKNLAVIVLAAGKGTRMKSALPKVLHPVAGRPMLFYGLNVLKELKVKKTVVVIGHGAMSVKEAFPSEKAVFIEQKEQLGTGHAVACGLKALRGFSGDVLILSGDVPLITKDTLKALKQVKDRKRGAGLALITAILDDPSGYGRVIRDRDRKVVRIAEDKDAKTGERAIPEVNTGIYLFSSDFLFRNIRKISSSNAQMEYYLPDLIEMASNAGQRVAALTHIEPEEVMGVNNRIELARASNIMRKRVLDSLMLQGVTIVAPENTYIDWGVKIGADTAIHPSATLSGNTKIGGNCVIEEGVKITDSTIGRGTTVKSLSVIESCDVGSGVVIGPFARLRPGSVISDNVRIGNFVEVKKSIIGKGTKANHLSYLGDAVIGKGVNIGAGTITCNYDGVKKYRTRIEDGAFIGSDTQLVAPVTVGKDAYVGSGTTVTSDVPPGSLMITRAKERVIEGWVRKKGIKK
ncbi:MAG: bifunctional UDP-N-acetylglucosamine diphosphorylase/glucosamine-1-phosphate N-acetyltransferase GlmU [Deltaproteobacteria bacterium]|nr:bifunctional UDP-N-acetylglucosamine diphosphorylase/glucosamine-1-phosphate N-acetyltransferase GlmU [Deltaproteobacteria bacterium]